MGNPRQERTGELRKAMVRIAELEKRNEYLEAALGTGKPPKRF